MCRRAPLRQLPILACAGLAACGPILAFDQPGVTVSQLASDLATCEAEAYDAAPPNIVQETRWRTDYRYIPVCYAGYCDYYYDRRWVPETITVDTNAGNRATRTLACMSARGYTAREVPRCGPREVPEAGLSSTARQAALSETACAVRLEGVGPLIIEPGAG